MSNQDPHPTEKHGRHRDRPPSPHVRGDHPAGATTDPSMGFSMSPEDRLHLPETPLDSGTRTAEVLWVVLALALLVALGVALAVVLL